MYNIIAVTSCPTGIAHSVMAAESLTEAGEEMDDISVHVETRGATGTENELTEEQIKEADAVIIAADTTVPMDRFQGKKILEVSPSELIKNPESVIEEAKNLDESAINQDLSKNDKDATDKVQSIRAQRSASRTGVYKHLLTGVSYMIPFVVAGGILIALSFAFNFESFAAENKGSLAYVLFQLGGTSAFRLIVPVLSGYIAFSIADRPGLAPGFITGYLVTLSEINAGFLGGIISGFLAGYVTLYLKENINLPKEFAGLKPILILPLLSTTIVGLVMYYIIGQPAAWLNLQMTNFLDGISGTSAVILGLVLGAMMAFDMGGPVNKAAYVFATGLLESDIQGPMAAVMAAGMTPPLGLALATTLKKDLFTQAEVEAGKAAYALGISFITEGAIPFAAKDPLRVIPSIMFGSAITGALSLLFGCTLAVPHGGIFVLFIPGAVGHLFLYIISILIGMVITAGAVIFAKSEFDVEQSSSGQTTTA